MSTPSNGTISSTANSYVPIKKWGSTGYRDGEFLVSLYDLPYIVGIAVDSSGNVYVADFGNQRIQKFDSNGKFITKRGSYGRENGQFVDPAGVAVDSSGNVYIVDVENDRIQAFAPITSMSRASD